MSEDTIDFRCPEDPRHLFMRLKRSGENVPITDDNLVELACTKCRGIYRNRGEEDVLRVLHYYNLLGELVENKVVRAAPEEIARFRRMGQGRANPS